MGSESLDILFSWLFFGVAAEGVLLFFLLFRRSRGVVPLRLLLAMFAMFTAAMALLILVVNLTEGPRAWAPEDGLQIAAAFVILAVVIALMIARPLKPDPARVDQAKRKRPLFVDIIGCLLIGAVMIVLLVVLIAYGTSLAN